MARSQISEIVRYALPVLLICAVIQIGGGSVLGGFKESFSLAGILVMIPPLLALRGNIGGALASRLGTGLHQGMIDPEDVWGEEVKINVGASLFLTFFASILIGLLGFAVTVLSGLQPFSYPLLLYLVTIALTGGMLSSIGLVGLTVFIAIFSYRWGWDPDNVTSPLIASLGDFFTIVSIYIGVLVVNILAGL